MLGRKEYVLSCFENSHRHTDLRRNAAAYDIRMFLSAPDRASSF
jgi:hypothetical protein